MHLLKGVNRRKDDQRICGTCVHIARFNHIVIYCNLWMMNLIP